MKKRLTQTYYFSVEGDTEKMYLEWLQKTINESGEAGCNVKFNVKKEKNPISRVKGMSILGKTDIVHMFDRESETEGDKKVFETTLDKMKKAENLGLKIKYIMGYSNLTFELWIILHKENCFTRLNSVRQYLDRINRAYNEKFISLKEYKRKTDFQRILSNITLEDVKAAIGRAKMIEDINIEKREFLRKYRGYRYCVENPSTSLGEIFEGILNDCEIM